MSEENKNMFLAKYGTEKHIDDALNSTDHSVRQAAIRNPNATPEHITKALNDEHPYVREAAIRNPNATPDHITKALNDEHPYVRQTAQMRLKDFQ